jgi:hypothetical protein
VNVAARGSFVASTLALAALLVAAGSAVWAWVTFDYWEAGPLIATVLTTAALTTSSLFVLRRRVLLAVIVGFFAGAATLTAVTAITVARWTR